MSDLERIEKLIESNARAIQALTEQASIILPRFDEMQRQVAGIQRQVASTQRQMIDVQRRIDDNTADIREITLDIRELIPENQRILKYLESRNQ